MSGTDPRSDARPRSERVLWRWPWFTAISRTPPMRDPVELQTLDERLSPNPEFSELASVERLEAAARALEANGIHAAVVPTGEAARRHVLELLTDGAEVFNNTSRTLETI